ncbi:MAG: hypothetical protein HGA47_03215, partial [Zoogloea sp.]|nr:hypothetical protein [Zoogloea sp.]
MLIERDSNIARAVSSPAAVLLVVFILLATLWWVLLQVEERDRAEVGKAAETQAANLAQAFEEHVLRSVQDIDSALLVLRRTWQMRRDYFGSEVSTLQQAYSKGLLLQISAIDRHGRLVYSNLPKWTPGTDLSDREHFLFHRNTDEDRLFISKPVLGRISGRTSIQLTRKTFSADGAFDGVLVVSLDPAYFAGFFGKVDVGRQ